MHPDEKKGLSNARYLRAKECLEAARLLLEAGDFKSAANRSYYAVFHAMRSVLAFDGIDMKHHSGIMSEFRRLYIKQAASINLCHPLFPFYLTSGKKATTTTSS